MFTLCLFIDRRRRLIGLICLSQCNHSFACENTSHCGLGSTLQNLNNLLKCSNRLWTFAQSLQSSEAEPRWKRHARMNTTLPVSSLPEGIGDPVGDIKYITPKKKKAIAWHGRNLICCTLEGHIWSQSHGGDTWAGHGFRSFTVLPGAATARGSSGQMPR